MFSAPPPQDPRTPSGPTPGPSSSPDSPKRFEARARSRLTVLLSVTGVVLSTFSARAWGFPVLVAALVLLVLGAASAVWCFPALKRAGMPRNAHAATAVLLAATLYFAVNCGINLVLWQQTTAYRDCVHDAVTISSQSRCQESLFQDLTGGGL